jgi:hypothetical protein
VLLTYSFLFYPSFSLQILQGCRPQRAVVLSAPLDNITFSISYDETQSLPIKAAGASERAHQSRSLVLRPPVHSDRLTAIAAPGPVRYSITEGGL